MSNEHYKILVAGYNCFEYVERCLESIWTQAYRDFDVCVVDDASTDARMEPFISKYCAERGWKYHRREKNGGACIAQWEGIQLLDPQDGDVVVWVDLDDALTGPQSLEILDRYYDDKTLMTYGNYRAMPSSATCPQVTRYPEQCIRTNDYRNIHKWGLRYNHLRTVRWDLLKHLNPEVDFKKDGKWLKLAMDMAIMIPCLEMSGGHFKYIDEILYEYSSDNPISEWRKSPLGTNETHDYLASLPKKRSIWSRELRQSLANSNPEPLSRRALPPLPLIPDGAIEKMPGLHVLIPSYNCGKWIERTVHSVSYRGQHLSTDSVLLIDDASTEEGYADLAKSLCDQYGFRYHRNEENTKCPYNLRLGIEMLDAEPDDIIFLLDGDDYLPPQALSVVMTYYLANPDLWMTYGQYEPKPTNTGQTLAMPYPKEIVENDAYRGFMHCFNHSISFRKHLWDQISDEDLQDDEGNWFERAYDSLIMHPMLELCGPDHYQFIPHTTYYYNAVGDNPDSAKAGDGFDPTEQILTRPKKKRYVR